jgi:DinB superfamily
MATQRIARPDESEYAPHFGMYIRLAPDGDLLSFLEFQLADLLGLLRGLPDRQSLAHHAPYTWSIRQVVGHITDCERVFGHRALWIARGDASPLAKFDENAFMRACNFDLWPLEELLAEFECVRRSHLLMFRHLEPDAWLRRGTVSGHPATARAFAYVIAGHAKHHLDILHGRLASA